MTDHSAPPVRMLETEDGVLTYVVASSPEALPPVRSAALADAWDAARGAALAGSWGPPRLLRFLLPEGATLDLLLADRDASCWADAVDRIAPLSGPTGLSLCLRLLALIQLLARARWTGTLCHIGRTGATLDPALLRTAATLALDARAGFDESSFRRRLASLAPPGAALLPSSGVQA